MLDQYVHAKHHPAVATTTSPVCAKCSAVKRSSKYSCCAQGGSWFKSCGSNGDFDHTWAEGLQACTNIESLFSVKTEPDSTLLNQTTASKQLNTVQHEGIESSVSKEHDTNRTNWKGSSELACIVVLVTLLITIIT